jgi:hypothetical protein
MDLSDQNFRQTENYFLDALADGARLGLRNYNYGLLPSRSGKRAYNGIRVSEHITGRIEVQLYSCNAITASGFRIDFDADEAGGTLAKNYSPADDKNILNRDIRQWDIVLAVDPFNRTPVGEPDPAETPPRHPDAQSSYALYVMPAGEINTMEFGQHHLTIGRVRKESDRYSVDTQYIPPCTSMSSHPELSDYYARFAAMFNSIEKSSKAILSKIHERSGKGDLVNGVQIICHDVLRYIARIYFDFRNRGRMAPPIDTVDYIASTAHTIYSSLTLFSTRQKAELLQYFQEWTDVPPGAFEKLLSDALDIVYKHDDLRAMMVRSGDFLKMFSELWERLALLDLVGQRRESIFISEQEAEKRSVSSGADSWFVE